MINQLIDQIKKRRVEIALALAEGRAINIESYHRLVGEYQGLGEALEMLDNLLQEDEREI
jgi:hypothetical protein